MPLTLAQAAQRVGLHRSNILRSIKRGKLSATRDESGAYQVDEAELVRAFPEVRTGPHQPAQPDALLELKLEHAERQCADLREQLARAYADVADWKEQARRVALPAPKLIAEPQGALSWWRWLRTTG